MVSRVLKEANLVMVDTNDLDRRLAYQTPPYEQWKSTLCSASPGPLSSDTLVSRIGMALCERTSKISTDKIRNEAGSVSSFVREVLRRSKSNTRSTVLAFAYFNKVYDGQSVKDKLPEFARCSKRVFLSCLILANKFLNDNSFAMKTWHMISGLRQKDLCLMERWCLDRLDYKLLVTETEYAVFENRLFVASNKRMRCENESVRDLSYKKLRTI
ncbi:hypothetical protein HG536_0E02930 [Torulaspora globosa]|uniref:Cyclin N-terminal domain-containing protein n=1 Tax=Torulaspora globosa TaxID=48254 RepID=A0A7G3ZIP6_9SACH|nr:uncharacterized protein HG536_0E02930 [Torulaspora globosa]QLL33382.1 hypothetical protein HG536_0E02930 [Torulaspora globosa]